MEGKKVQIQESLKGSHSGMDVLNPSTQETEMGGLYPGWVPTWALEQDFSQ